MLDALITGGLSQNDIAHEIGVSQPTIHRALRGRQIIYETGKAIERLYESRCAHSECASDEHSLPAKDKALQGGGSAVQASSSEITR